MKWYLGAINSVNYISKNKIKYLFKKKFFSNPPEEGDVINTDNIHYAEIYNNKYLCHCENEIDEKILILGDIEIYNKRQLQNKYLNSENNINKEKLLIYLYRLKGISFIEELSGEYSFVIFDKEKNIIYLIVDHLAIKPLFWIKEGEKVFFATDIFLLKDYFDINKLNKQYFEEYYYYYGQINGEYTTYNNLYRVESGSYVCFSLSDNRVIKHKYWDLVNLQKDIYLSSEKEYIEQFLYLLKNSVERRLLNNNKNGILMSGGLDSTSLYAISKSIIKSNVLPVCGIFEVLKDCDESYYIDKVLDRYNQKAKYVTCDDLGLLKGYPDDYFPTDEPFTNSMTLKFTEELIKEASKNGIENIIDGFAADNLLTGSLERVIDKLRKGRLIETINDIRKISLMENRTFFQSIKKFIVNPILNPLKLPGIDDNLLLSMINKTNKIKSFNQKQFYIQMNCTKAIRYSDREINPRYNVSAKHPYLDKDLIEYMFNIPGDFRLNKEASKYILRKAVHDILPFEVVSRLTKTQHVSLTYKGILDVWKKIYTISKDFRIGEFEFINISKNDWEIEMYKYRSGQVVRNDFLILLSMELWLYEYQKTLLNKNY